MVLLGPGCVQLGFGSQIKDSRVLSAIWARAVNGATLFSGPHKSITKGTTFTVTLSAPGTIYLFFENSGRSGGYEQQLLGTGKWVKTADIIKWGGGCCKGTM